MSIKMSLEEEMVNIMSAYDPQVGCVEEDKVAFWEEMDRCLSETPAEERLIIGGDLNRHVGQCREVIGRVHGGWGVGEINEGEKIVDCAMAFDLAIVNTWFGR